MIKTKTWVLLFGAVILACVGMMIPGEENPATAKVYQNGVCIRTIDLTDPPFTFTVEGEHGANTIEVEPGRVRVTKADCPDKTCVHMGWSSQSPIVCLPHRLVIEFEGGGLDAAAG